MFLEALCQHIAATLQKLERVSWHDNRDESAVSIIKEIILITKEIHAVLIRFYVRINNSKAGKILKPEIKDLKSSTDDLREISQDLEFVFINSPNDEEMIGLVRRLSLL